MENRTNCLICLENQTNTRCHQCTAEYHFACLDRNHLLNPNNTRCHQCNQEFNEDILNNLISSLRLHEERNRNEQLRQENEQLRRINKNNNQSSRGENFIAGVIVGAVGVICGIGFIIKSVLDENKKKK